MVSPRSTLLTSEMTGSRIVPGFSSDLIRADQAKSFKRGQSGSTSLARTNKLKAIEAAKVAHRRRAKEVEPEDEVVSAITATPQVPEAAPKPIANGDNVMDIKGAALNALEHRPVAVVV